MTFLFFDGRGDLGKNSQFHEWLDSFVDVDCASELRG